MSLICWCISGDRGAGGEETEFATRDPATADGKGTFGDDTGNTQHQLSSETI